MKLMTISEVTKAFNVTARMLRYYDQIGLLPSTRQQDYAYRMYDESALRRLQQIIALRKLRIPLKKIALIFSDIEQAEMIRIFQESIDEVNSEITALQTIRDILNAFITRMNTLANTSIELDMLNDADLLSIIQTLSLSKIKLKEDCSMDDLNKANEVLSTLKNVRIIHLPPCTVAASHYFGDNPEENAMKPLQAFIRSIELPKIKPDLRVFGFNNPTPTGNETYGYEFWVTIPEDLVVPSYLQKKHFEGGLYAAHCIKMGDFHEWQLLSQWVMNNSEYEYDAREPSGMNGLLEEQLNAYSYFAGDENATQCVQLDLLFPIKAK
jgi:DNA-binding transcriptional MerR regulator/DNA gyrase inhibitor GyrI